MEVFIGTVQAFGFNFAPQGWMTCQGQTLSIAQNTALFSLLGTTYGGNGQNTFMLPNLQGRTIVGQGSLAGGGQYTMGQIGGQENTTLATANMPMHTHAASAQVSIPAFSDAGNTSSPSGNILSVSSSGNIYTNEQGDESLRGFPTNVQVQPAGGSLPFNNQSPYLAMNYSIAINGLFPPRP